MVAIAAAQTTEKMKALVQDGYGSADVLRIREVEKPVATEGRVVVRVRAASLNALDWHSVHGGRVIQLASAVMRQKDEPVRGVDLAGVVESVGPNVTRFKPGDEVFGGAPAAFAEYARAREAGLALKPRDLSFEEAATVGVAARTALQGLRDHAQLKPGQRVLINGAGGGVGTFAVQIAKALGAHVTAVTGTRNVELIRSLGPDEVIDYTKEDFARRGERYDAIFDVAASRSFSDMRRVLVPGGIIVLAGADKRGGLAIFTRIGAAFLRSRLLKQRVVFFVAKATLEDLLVLKGLLEERKIRPAIDRTYPLSEGAEAIRYLGTGNARAKVVITMG
ncbi:MAG TPA: NAD(P)-dependent alcohol dehydrogenase [Candidatus Limnocylindria bacterium]|nr:NAD(P)-dependent alcohol dehydrogenase [Candidatus Limnocylindria bacterium]